MGGDGADDSVSRSNKRKRAPEDRIQSGIYCYAQCFVYTCCVYVYAIDSKSASEIGSERQMRGDGDSSVSSGRKRGPEDRSQSSMYSYA